MQRLILAVFALLAMAASALAYAPDHDLDGEAGRGARHTTGCPWSVEDSFPLARTLLSGPEREPACLILRVTCS